MVKDIVEKIICSWYFRPEAMDRLSSRFFATMVVL
jgi:hypothetical protein